MIGSLCSRTSLRHQSSRQESLSKRAPGNKTDPQFPAGWKHLWFGVSRPNRIFALDCRDRLDRVCATDGVCSGFRKAEVLYLAGLNQILHRPRYILDRYVWIDAVLVQDIDDVGLEAFE